MLPDKFPYAGLDSRSYSLELANVTHLYIDDQIGTWILQLVYLFDVTAGWLRQHARLR